MNKLIRFTDEELKLIIKAEINIDSGEIESVQFGLPRTSSRLEKFLSNLTRIYCNEVMAFAFHEKIRQSKPYKKVMKVGIK